MKAPGYGDRRKAMLGDIAMLTGGTAIFKDLGIKLDSRQALRPRHGQEGHRSTAENTTIIGGGRQERGHRRPGRADSPARSKRTDSDYDREKLQERLAKLAGGVAQINVGAATETEMKERKALLEDAKAATQAALDEGIVPGGGVALLRCEKVARQARPRQATKSSAPKIVRNVLDYPLRCIAENAGVDGAVVVNRVRQMKGKNDGYDADKDEYGDLVAAGIIDPAKVVRTALQNAASVAALLLTTESLVTEIPKRKKKPAAATTTTTTAWVAWAEWAVAWEAWAAWAAWAA